MTYNKRIEIENIRHNFAVRKAENLADVKVRYNAEADYMKNEYNDIKKRINAEYKEYYVQAIAELNTRTEEDN